jgi:hypothetical protein
MKHLKLPSICFWSKKTYRKMILERDLVSPSLDLDWMTPSTLLCVVTHQNKIILFDNGSPSKTVKPHGCQ